jgi:hypothetical protein
MHPPLLPDVSPDGKIPNKMPAFPSFSVHLGCSNILASVMAAISSLVPEIGKICIEMKRLVPDQVA